MINFGDNFGDNFTNNKIFFDPDENTYCMGSEGALECTQDGAENSDSTDNDDEEGIIVPLPSKMQGFAKVDCSAIFGEDVFDPSIMFLPVLFLFMSG